MIKGIHHVSMKCASPEELASAEAFYCGLLGLKIVRRWPEGIMIDTGCGIGVTGHSLGGAPAYMLCLECDDFTCGVNLDGLSIGMISNLGRPFVGDLEAVFNDRIEKGSILVTDSFRGYSKLANRNELTHIAIPRGKHKNGAFNIQAVNSYHSEMKRLVQSNFKGVSTKYLNNYIVYHNFVNFAKETFKEKLSILKEFAFTTKLNDRCKLIPLREPIPTLRDST